MTSYYTCSFCGIREQDAKRIVAKGGRDEPAICSKCIVSCVNVIINAGTVMEIEKKGANKGELILDMELAPRSEKMSFTQTEVAQSD